MFAWRPSDMKGVSREVVEHKLNIKTGSKLVKQCLRRFNEDKCKAIGEEILKLLSARFICEVYHPEWLANPIHVKKKNKKWSMCVDYTSLNNACPKDPFPLPRIDQGRFNGRVRDPLFSRCVLRVPPDCDVHSGPTRNLVHNSVQRVLLSNDDLLAQECGRNFPTMHVTRLRGVDRPHHRSVHRRHCSQVEENRGSSP
jgi:hypothetical protein